MAINGNDLPCLPEVPRYAGTVRQSMGRFVRAT